MYSLFNLISKKKVSFLWSIMVKWSPSSPLVLRVLCSNHIVSSSFFETKCTLNIWKPAISLKMLPKWAGNTKQMRRASAYTLIQTTWGNGTGTRRNMDEMEKTTKNLSILPWVYMNWMDYQNMNHRWSEKGDSPKESPH